MREAAMMIGRGFDRLVGFRASGTLARTLGTKRGMALLITDSGGVSLKRAFVPFVFDLGGLAVALLGAAVVAGAICLPIPRLAEEPSDGWLGIAVWHGVVGTACMGLWVSLYEFAGRRLGEWALDRFGTKGRISLSALRVAGYGDHWVKLVGECGELLLRSRLISLASVAAYLERGVPCAGNGAND
jgi:hypothetical protein